MREIVYSLTALLCLIPAGSYAYELYMQWDSLNAQVAWAFWITVLSAVYGALWSIILATEAAAERSKRSRLWR